MFFRLFDALWDGARLLNPFIYIIFVLLLGREIPRAKGSSSLRENLDNFLEQMDNPLWYVSTPFVAPNI